MAEIINLEDRLGRLSQTVQHRIAMRNERLQSEHAAKQARKAADWQTVQENHPDVAAHISEFAAVFGRPAMLRVTDNSGTVILDTRRYER